MKNLRVCVFGKLHPSSGTSSLVLTMIVFPIPLWETWFCQSLGVPIPVLLENPRQCPCRQFSFDHYGDHIHTCQRQCASLPAHEWIVYRLSLLLCSVGHRVKTHRITPAADNERGDIEIQDYVPAFVLIIVLV